MGKRTRSSASDEVQQEQRQKVAKYDPIKSLTKRLSTAWFDDSDIVDLDDGSRCIKAAQVKVSENDAKCKHDLALIHKLVSNLRHRPNTVDKSSTNNTFIVQQSDAELLAKAGVQLDDLYSDDSEFADVGADKAH